jgi:hypothetical protein
MREPGPSGRRLAVGRYLLGLAGFTVLAWIAADALIGIRRPYLSPADYAQPLHWTMSWLWFAPLPYAFAWFVLVSGRISRAFLALCVLAVLNAVIMLPASLPLIAMMPLVALVSIPFALVFGLAMAALQDEVPPSHEKEWRTAHMHGCLAALPAFSFTMVMSYAVPSAQGGWHALLLHQMLPLAVLLAGWMFHAARCWRLLAPERRGTAQGQRVVVLSGVGAAVAAAISFTFR